MGVINVKCTVEADIFANGKHVENGRFACERTQSVTFCVIPSFENVPHLSYSVPFDVENDDVARIGNGAQAVTWKNGIFDVTFTPPEVGISHSPKTLWQTKTENGLFTLYDDGRFHLMCEGNSFHVHDVPFLLTYEAKSCEVNGETVIVLQGKRQDGDYFLSLACGEKIRVLHDITADKIEVFSSGIVAENQLFDMKKRIEKTTYRTPQLVVDKTFVRTERAFPPQLIPYLFLESVLAGDREDGLSLLSKDFEDFDAIKDYLPPFTEICDCSALGLDERFVALIDGSQPVCHPKVFEFEVQNGVIANVIPHACR